MKIACNYYPETVNLVKENKIEIDYIKFPSLVYQMNILEKGRENEFQSFCEEILNIKPILLHGLYPAPHDLAIPDLKSSFDFKTAERLISATKTPGLSFHLSLHQIDTSVSTKDLIKTITENIRFLQDTYPDLEFLSVENTDSRKFGALLDPEVVSEIVHITDCDFLLDISHAFCASYYRNESLLDYIYKFPLDKLYEIHINGWAIQDNKIMCHIKTNGTGYKTLDTILKDYKPEIITVEYGRDYDKLNIGIPLMSPDRINRIAEDEITDQVKFIHNIICSH